VTLAIALWGSAGLPNVGDRLISIVVRDELRRRIGDCRVDLFSPWAGDRGTGGLPVQHLSFGAGGGWPLAGAYDAVVVPGGGVFAGPPFLHPIMKMFCLGNDPAIFAPGLYTAWHAVGVQDDSPEPAAAPEQEYLRALGKRLDHCTVRDPDAARRIGTATGPPAPEITPDPVFALPPQDPPRDPARTRARRPVIGVSVGGAPLSGQLADATLGAEAGAAFGWDLCLAPEETIARIGHGAGPRQRLRGQLARAIIELGEQGELLIIGIRNMYGDDTLAQQLAAALPEARCAIAGVTDHDEVTALYGACDVVLASRYHSAVLALRAGTPVVGVDTSAVIGPSKLHSLLAQLGMADRYWGVAGMADQLPAIVSVVLSSDVSAGEAAGRYRAMHDRAVADLAALAAGLADLARLPSRAGQPGRAGRADHQGRR
jgi:polysaccharide pyruvyl transferase WcaK-like protein